MSWSRDTAVFVSGGAGVIGNALVQRLQDRGVRLLVGDLEPRPEHWSDSVSYRRGDLNYIERRELEAFQPRVFFHLAATFERSTETPDFWDENAHHNVNLSHHLMSCMKDLPSLERVVFASSYLIYDPSLYSSADPPTKATRLSEDCPIAPRNLCGSAKLHHEIELSFLQSLAANGPRMVSARIFRSYGRGSRDIVSRWVRAALAGETLEVFGSEAMFDYVAADDVAEGLLRLAESPACGVVNLGTGRARRVAELVSVLREHFPQLQTRETSTAIAYEAAEADTTRLREMVGWSPETSLEQMVQEIIRFERQRSSPARLPANVLVMSAAKKVPLLTEVRRAIAKLGSEGQIHAADTDPGVVSAKFADRFWECPPLDRLEVDVLLDYCRQHEIGFLIPTRDGELEYFARNAEVLSTAGVSVFGSPLEAVTLCLDKLRFAQALEAHGLPMIPTREDLDAIEGARLVVKERFGSGSQGVHCDVDRNQARRLAKNLRTPIFQPFISGTEFSVDLYVQRSGRLRGIICRSRDRVVAGESQVTTTRQLPELESLCCSAARVLGIRGHAVFQALQGPDGEIQLIECNARFGGASTLSVAAGLDSFNWFLLEASGSQLDAHPFLPRPSPLMLVRHAADQIFS